MKLYTLTALAVVTLGLSACNESAREDAADVRASRTAIAKDNAALSEYERNLEHNRREKAAAKAEGNYVKQAGESLQIGANKAAIAGKKTERKVDERILEEDEEDLYKQ